MKINFEEFLIGEHAKNYVGTDDNMPDSFDAWLADLDSYEWIVLGDKYGIKVARQQLEDGHNETMKIIKEAFSAKKA